MRRNLLVALTALAACFRDAGPGAVLPATTTGTTGTTAPDDGSTGPAVTSSTTGDASSTASSTTDITTSGLTTTDDINTGTSTGPAPPVCGDTLCDLTEDCNTCALDCGPCPLGLPPGGRPDPACIGDEGSGGPTCGNLNGAYTTAAVNVGYYPFRIKPGVDTALYTCDDRSIEPLAAGQGFAAQSTQNPGCSDNPPLRDAVAGFVFGYSRDTGKSGWVPADALEFVGYDGGACADGPTAAAFQVAHNPYDGCQATPCDGVNSCLAANPINPKDPNNSNSDCGGFPISANRTVALPDLALNAAPGANPTHYLHQNDQVKILYFNKNGWVFVELKVSNCPLLTPVGLRGWVDDNPDNFVP